MHHTHHKRRRQRRHDDTDNYASIEPFLRSAVSEGPENAHLRDLQSYPYREGRIPEKFKGFFETKILPHTHLTGYKLDEKRKTALQIVHNLVLAGLRGAVIADSRRNGFGGLRVSIWDSLERAGLVLKCLGSEESKKVTRYQATPELLNLFDRWKLLDLFDPTLVKNTERKRPVRDAYAYLHTGTRNLETGKKLKKKDRKKPLPFPVELFSWLRTIETAIEFINSRNLDHAFKAFREARDGTTRLYPVSPCLRRIWSGRIGLGGRWYTYGRLGGQQLKKHERRSMLIDGKPVAELDYSGCQLRMCYHVFLKREVSGDVYRPRRIFPTFYATNPPAKRKKLIRELVKKATLICLNASSFHVARGSLEGFIKNHKRSRFLKRVIGRIEGTDIAGFVRRVIAAHPRLEDKFFQRIGCELMDLEATVMLSILLRFANARKPVLAIHDGLVVRESDIRFARCAMIECYKSQILFRPKVERSA